MKVLGVLGSIVISFVMIILIFVLSLSFILEDVVENKLVVGAFKEVIKESFLDNNQVDYTVLTSSLLQMRNLLQKLLQKLS